MKKQDVVNQFRVLIDVEIANLIVEREKLVQLKNDGAGCPGINAIDAVIRAKETTVKNLPK